MSCSKNAQNINLTTCLPENRFSREMNATWSSFSLRWKAQRWRRGCFSLSRLVPAESQDPKTSQDSVFIPQSGSSRNETQGVETLSSEKEEETYQTKNSELTPKIIDLDLWNRYWKAYSDQYGDLLDGLAMLLDKTDAAPVSWCAVFLALKRTTPCSTHHPESKDDEVLEYIQKNFGKWVHAASHRFGAIESMDYNQWIVKIQFTGPEAAAAFQLWASDLSLETFLRTRPDGESLPPKYETPSSKTLLSEFHLQACLAPRNATKTSAFLKLGYGMLLPTAHVQALLIGLFDATKIIYKPQDSSFVISFKDFRSARLAIHALQFSLLEVFNMSLEFCEEGVIV
ncbi:unnamed protein product [Phytomonas sp. Hart1]|nr:unnamed protein product [Phytomonas sp. Hart1]|eukprot:CCW66615.1 unnamed protein product [Phytomonas sp. isolate Hart1]